MSDNPSRTQAEINQEYTNTCALLGDAILKKILSTKNYKAALVELNHTIDSLKHKLEALGQEKPSDKPQD